MRTRLAPQQLSHLTPIDRVTKRMSSLVQGANMLGSG
jgi:hypothetical protein